MAKITRYNGNVAAPASAALAGERTVFGGSGTSDTLAGNVTAALLRGWGIVGPADKPTREDFNAAMFTLGQFNAYLHQMGVPEYNASQEYHIGSVVQSGGSLFVSQANTNVGNLLTDQTKWLPLTPAATNTTVLLGVGGADFATLTEALDYAYRAYRPGTAVAGDRPLVVITIAAGKTLAEQIILDGVDLSWIQIDATDAVTTVTRSALTVEATPGTYPFIACLNGARSPVINFVAEMDSSGSGTGRVGYLAHGAGSSINGLACGVQDAAQEGVTATMGGQISAVTLDCSGAGVYGMIAVLDGRISVLSNADCTGAGSFGASAGFGGSISVGDTLDCSGASGYDGVSCNGGLVSAGTIVADSAGRYGVYARGGGIVRATQDISATGSTDAGIYADAGTISARTTINASGSTAGVGAWATSGGLIRCAGNMNASGCATGGSLATGGGRIEAGGDLNNSASAGTCVRAAGGGQVICQGAMDNSGGLTAVLIGAGGRVVCQGNMDNSGSTTSAGGVYGVEVLRGGELLTNGTMDNTGGTAPALGTLVNGGRIAAGTLNAQVGAAPAAGDLDLSNGGWVSRTGGNGQTNVTPGTIQLAGFVSA